MHPSVLTQLFWAKSCVLMDRDIGLLSFEGDRRAKRLKISFVILESYRGARWDSVGPWGTFIVGLRGLEVQGVDIKPP